MVKTYKMQTIDVVNGKLEGVTKNLVLEEDYLKVVEALNSAESRLERVVESKDITNNQLRKVLKEKDEEIELWKKRYDDLWNEKVFVDGEEETWTLKYIFENSETGEIKPFEQNGMIKEDAEELIGMDSDNWNHWSLTKEEKPNKDKIIEGLLIRAESSEEALNECERLLQEMSNAKDKYKELYHDTQRVGAKDLRA